MSLETQTLPVLPLRDVVVYPHMVIPLFVGRVKSIKALDRAMEGNKQILLIAQKSPTEDDPGEDETYDVGTMANILQLLKLPDGTIKVLVEGTSRATIYNYRETEGMFVADAKLLEPKIVNEQEMDVHVRSAVNQFEQYVKLNKKVPPEIISSLVSIDDSSRLADTIAAHMAVKIEEKQHVLGITDVKKRLEYLIELMESEIDLLHVEKKIRGRVKSQMEKSQREYYLNEQMKAIQNELGDMEDVPNEIDDLANKIKKAGMHKEAKGKAESELSKLRMMSPMSAEATVVRNYIDWLLNVPWKKRSKVSKDIVEAEAILEADHYGLEKVKERILEYLAVQQRVKKMKGPILCLVGPPGVGKTSLGRSIARATHREFARMSLGGIRDEAEIRGHRRTYIGSMPGKIIQGMSKIGKKNPLFLLDEIDKMAMDFRGDPASALLEVLDPEQNSLFNDHYLEVDYDLSEVMFVTTANSLNIPAPLLDRMEVIRLSGYTEDEKVNIAKNYLIEKQMTQNGLKNDEIAIRDSVIRDIIQHYTREAGVRNLDREIANICRKIVKRILLKPSEKKVTVTSKKLESLLGVKHYRYGMMEEENRIGQVTGLAWTEVGGELLTIETAIVDGKGKITRTGKLGEVMQESIEAAMTVVRSRSELLGIDHEFYKEHDFHIHVPEGATPKDGPSAGVAMCTAMVSALCSIPVRSSVAMTGEITLRGEVLPIGGLKEKLLAALRGGLQTVLIPEENKRELVEIPKNIKQNLDIRPVRWIDEVFEIALEKMPEPSIKKQSKSDVAADKNKEKNDSIRPH